MPRRIRQAYQARLEVNGLWTAPAEESEVEKPKRFGEKEAEKDDPKQKFKSAFQRERVGTQVILQTTGFIRSDYNRSWKSRARLLISTQGCWVTKTFSSITGANDSKDMPYARPADKVLLGRRCWICH